MPTPTPARSHTPQICWPAVVVIVVVVAVIVALPTIVAHKGSSHITLIYRIHILESKPSLNGIERRNLLHIWHFEQRTQRG